MEEFSMKANLDRLRVSEALEYSNKVNEDRGKCECTHVFRDSVLCTFHQAVDFV